MPLPWTAFKDENIHFWVHYSLVIVAFLLAIVTAIAQWRKPAPYGKHDSESEAAKWGVLIPQRFGHVLSDAVPGVILFVLIFALLGGFGRGPVNIVFLFLWMAHYLHRGIFHPMTMRYSNNKVPLGITIGGLIPNCLYHGLNADWIGSANYDGNYYYDPRFLLGLVVFVVGYVINRWADWKLRNLRKNRTPADRTRYFIPYGGLFNLITCPNYFGEMVQWLGWSLATWSLAGLVWWMFSCATFIPRSRHNHRWYKEEFSDYPTNRKALIPLLY